MSKEEIQFKNLSRLLTETIVVSVPLIERTGGMHEAFFLSRLLWNTFNNPHVEKKDGWFFHTSEQWEAVGITERVRRSIQERFVALKILDVKRMDVPAKNYYKLNLDELQRFLSDVTFGDILMSQNVTSRSHEMSDLDVTKGDIYSYKKLKKELKEETPVGFEILVGKLGDAKPSKKTIMQILGYNEVLARKVQNEIKQIVRLEDRKSYIMDLFVNGKPQKTKSTFNERLDRKTLPPSEYKNLEDLAYFYKGHTDILPEITQARINAFYDLRTKFKYEDLKYVIVGCLRLARTNPFYARNFDQALTSENINRFLTDPLLKTANEE